MEKDRKNKSFLLEVRIFGMLIRILLKVLIKMKEIDFLEYMKSSRIRKELVRMSISKSKFNSEEI